MATKGDNTDKAEPRIKRFGDTNKTANETFKPSVESAESAKKKKQPKK